MARPKKDPLQADTRSRILEAAGEEFGRRGFEGARLEDIAARIGIRRASLFHYFESKEALYQEAVQATFSFLRRRLWKVFRARDTAAQAVERLVTEYLAFAEEYPASQQLFMRELVNPGGEGYAMLSREVLPLLSGVERFLKARGGPRLRDPASLRQAVLTWSLSAAARAAMGPHAKELWGRSNHDLALARAMVFSEAG
ncbi:MAG TPA: TetR family transcriptional regulator [Bdellovibrionota bacterium]|jgi:AcrR family transcriptional regulator|nr:TetR family transcriptional regulator [Bdellovibrionota bacterium]